MDGVLARQDVSTSDDQTGMSMDPAKQDGKCEYRWRLLKTGVKASR